MYNRCFIIIKKFIQKQKSHPTHWWMAFSDIKYFYFIPSFVFTNAIMLSPSWAYITVPTLVSKI